MIAVQRSDSQSNALTRSAIPAPLTYMYTALSISSASLSLQKRAQLPFKYGGTSQLRPTEGIQNMRWAKSNIHCNSHSFQIVTCWNLQVSHAKENRPNRNISHGKPDSYLLFQKKRTMRKSNHGQAAQDTCRRWNLSSFFLTHFLKICIGPETRWGIRIVEITFELRP